MLAKSSLEFLEDLKKNNNRDWFLEHKKRYDAFKKDYQQLVAKLLSILKPLDPSLEMLEVKNCTFRINRDIRFSKDKSPYKTNLGIWISSGIKSHNRAGYYIHIENGASFIAGGLYAPEANELKKIRKEIAYFYDDLEAILTEKSFQKEFKTLEINERFSLKNPPRGYEKDHPAITFLKLKNFVASQQFDTQDVLKPDFATKISEKLLVLKPLNDFLNRGLESDE